jgi:adenylate cyclase
LSTCSLGGGLTVATQVLGRKADFDPNLDPIVRIMAGRLRRALERYYATHGRQDQVRIDIPKGSYVPIF